MTNRIRQLRQSRGMSLEQLARLSGISFQQLSRLELGQRRLSDFWMRKLAPHLGVRPSDLMSDGEPDAREFVEFSDEQGLLRFWRLLTVKEKRAFIAFAKALGSDLLTDDTHQRRA